MHIMDKATKKSAIQLSELGESEKLHNLIKPYIESSDAFALYLYAGYSLPSFNESETDFAERNIALLTEASKSGIDQASYQMGVNYLYGDDVIQSFEKAKEYFEKAIEQGHSYTKFTYGFSLFYGTDQNIKDEARGLDLMNQAKEEGIDLAAKEIAKIAEKNA